MSKCDLLRFPPLTRNFINCTPSSHIHDPASGLELSSILTSVELLKVNLIRQLILQCWQHYSAPFKRFISVQAAINSAFCNQDLELDFLRIHIFQFARTSRWQAVSDYWKAAIAT